MINAVTEKFIELVGQKAELMFFVRDLSSFIIG